MLKKFFFVLMFLPIIAFADTSKGEKLLHHFWKEMTNNKFKAIEKHVSSKFKSEREDGSRNRWSELAFMNNLNITSYKLTDIKITKEHNVLIISYLATIEETPLGKSLSQAELWQSLTTFEKVDDHWKCITTAYIRVKRSK